MGRRAMTAMWLIGLALAAPAQDAGVVPATHEDSPGRVETEIVGPWGAPPVVPRTVPAVAEPGQGGVLSSGAERSGAGASDLRFAADAGAERAVAQNPQDQPAGMNFQNQTLDVFARTVQRVTGRTILWTVTDTPQAVTFDVHSSRSITDPAELWEFFQLVCHALGYVVVEVATVPGDGGQRQVVYELRKRDGVRGLSPEVLPPDAEIPETSAVYTRTFTLQNVAVADAATAIQTTLGTGFEGYLLQFATSNQLIVMDTGRNLRRVRDLIAAFDVPPEPMEYETVMLQHVRVADVLDLVQAYKDQILQQGTSGAGGAAAAAQGQPAQAQQARVGSAQQEQFDIQSNERLNQLILVGRRRRIDQIVPFLQALDRPSATIYRIEVRRLRYAFIREVIETMSHLVGSGVTVEMGRQMTNERGIQVSGSSTSSSSSSTSSSSGTNTSTTTSPTGSLFLHQDQPQEPGTRTGGGGGGGEGPDPFQSGPFTTRVVGDEPTNSLIIMADPDTFPMLDRMISELDRPRYHIAITTEVMQIIADEDFDLGVELARARDVDDGDLDLGVATSNGISTTAVDPTTGQLQRIPDLTAGLILALFQDRITNIPVLLRATRSVNDVRVLQQPQIVTRDNERAQILVQEEVPFLNRTIANGITNTSVDFKRAPTRLTILPTMADHDRIHLAIDLEVSRFLPRGDAAVDLPPALISRQMTSNVTVPNGMTVILGGLVNEEDTEAVSGVPVLMDLPILGHLFRRETDSHSRSLLYIFVTPRIIADHAYGDWHDATGGPLDELEEQETPMGDIQRGPPEEPRIQRGFQSTTPAPAPRP